MKQKLASNILLYLRHDVAIYHDFISILNHCTENSFSKDDYNKLVCTTQDMLADVWYRMKQEAGISERSEKKIIKKFKKAKRNK